MNESLEGYRPSTMRIMSMMESELRRVYAIRDGLQRKLSGAISAVRDLGCPKYYCHSRSRSDALHYADMFIDEIERYRGYYGT